MSAFEDIRSWGAALLVGETVVLRELRAHDLPALIAWYGDPGESALGADGVTARSASVLRTRIEAASANDSTAGAGYSVVTAGGLLVGHVAVAGIGTAARIGSLTGTVGPEFQGRGYGTDAIRVALRVAFEELGAHKVEARALAADERALHVLRSVGFVEEGRRRAAAFHRSAFHDEVHLGILEPEHSTRRERARRR